MKKHTTHFDDCGCLTLRYTLALNALMAIKKHMELSFKGDKMGLAMSAIYQYARRAIEQSK